ACRTPWSREAPMTDATATPGAIALPAPARADRADTSDDGRFLPTAPPARGERRVAATIACLSLLAFGVIAPFAYIQLAVVPAFIPVYQSALIVGDLITAVLLFGQFTILGGPALLALACGYLFAALMAGAHLLTFPGLFAPGGLLGANGQSTAWLYMF